MGAYRVNIGGIEISDAGMDAVAEELAYNVSHGVQTAVYTPNAEALYLCLKDKETADVFKAADINVPDGAGVLLAAKLLGQPMKNGRVAGVDLGMRLVQIAAERGFSLYLFGGSQGVAEKAACKLSEKHPDLAIVGFHDGFSFSENDIISEINGSGADILFVCLGMPKQEKWIYENKKSLSAKLIIGLGGSLDIYSESKKRAPEAFIKLRLEWLYRLIQEPRRIKRIIKLPLLFFAVTFDGIKSRAQKRKEKRSR